MNGPEHYREAERLLAESEGAIRDAAISGSDVHMEVAQEVAASGLAAAQVHAILALTAATAADQATGYDGDENYSRSRGWAGVA